MKDFLKITPIMAGVKLNNIRESSPKEGDVVGEDTTHLRKMLQESLQFFMRGSG